MVRIKHRYLLAQILYPPGPPTSTTTTTTRTQPPLLNLHAPTPDTLTIPALLRLLRTHLSLLFGDHGAAVAGSGLQIKYWSNATSTFIVRCKREAVRAVWAAVTWVRGVGVGEGGGGGRGGREREKEREREVVVRVLRVSGTVRKCEEEAIRQARALCGRVRGLAVAAEAGLKGAGVVWDGMEAGDDENYGVMLEEERGLMVDDEEEIEDSGEEE